MSIANIVLVTLYKNGVEFKRGLSEISPTDGYGAVVSALIYLDGSTDYVELWVYHN